MGKRMPSNTGRPAIWPFTIMLPTGAVHEFATEAEAVRFMLRCDHNFASQGTLDPGHLEADRYLQVKGCTKCCTWFVAGGPAWRGPTPFGSPGGSGS